jgi:hypothetical protein
MAGVIQNNVLTPDPQGGMYKHVDNTSSYHYSPGVLVLPLAYSPSAGSTDSPVALVRVHAPYATRTVDWATRKDLSPPRIPKPDSVENFYFVGGDISVSMPIHNNQGSSYSWAVTGSYQYIETVPRTSTTSLPTARLPFVATSDAYKNVGAGDIPNSFNFQTDSTLLLNPNLINQAGFTYLDERFPGAVMTDGIILG